MARRTIKVRETPEVESKIKYVGPLGSGLGPTPPTDDDISAMIDKVRDESPNAEEISAMIDKVRADHAAGASDGPGHWDDSRVAKTAVHEAQPGVYNEKYDKATDDMDHGVYDPAEDPDVAKTAVQPGVFSKSPTPAEAQEMTFQEPVAETAVHEAQPGIADESPPSYPKDTDVGTARRTVPQVNPGPGIPSGGRRLRRHLKDL